MQHVRMNIRVPEDVACFLSEQAELNLTSRNAELVRSVRERMADLHFVERRNEQPAKK